MVPGRRMGFGSLAPSPASRTGARARGAGRVGGAYKPPEALERTAGKGAEPDKRGGVRACVSSGITVSSRVRVRLGPIAELTLLPPGGPVHSARSIGSLPSGASQAACVVPVETGSVIRHDGAGNKWKGAMA